MIVIRSGNSDEVIGITIKEGDQQDADDFNKKQDPYSKYWMQAEVIEFNKEIEVVGRPEARDWKPKIKPPKIKSTKVYNVNVIQEWGEWKYGMTSNQWHAKYWSPHNGFCGEFMDPEPFVEFNYKEAPVTMIDCYMNEFFKDHPELNGVIRLYFDS